LEISKDDPTVTTMGDGFDERFNTMALVGIPHRAQSVVVPTAMYPASVYRMLGGTPRQDDMRAKDLAGVGQRIVLGMHQRHVFQGVAARKMMDFSALICGSGRRSNCAWTGIGIRERRKVALLELKNTIL